MLDFTNVFQENLIPALLSGFDLLWKALSENPLLLIFFAFLLIGNTLVNKMNKHHHHH